MKLVYMGTPDFAVPPLVKLHEKGYEIGYVVSQPDSARDRGKKIKNTAVKEAALKLGLEVLQPEKLKGNDEFIEVLKQYEPDLIVVAAYGKILPKEILDIPKKACINIHGSLLPKLRGAAPIQYAILEGHKATGITIMEMAEGLDTGDIIAKREYEVQRETAGELFEILSQMGAELLADSLPDIDELLENKEKQKEEDATYASMITKEEGHVTFDKVASEIDNQIRGMTPSPGAFIIHGGEKYKVFISSILERERAPEVEAGEIVGVGKEGILIAAKDKILKIEEIQAPGKKRMKVSDFIAGNKNKFQLKEIIG